MMMKKRRLSVLAMILCFVLCVGLFPISVSADYPDDESKHYTLQITKTIAQSEDVDESLIDLIDVNDAFSQMQFTLYANEDIINPTDGSIITQRNNIAMLYNPILGKYTIQGITTTHTNGVFLLENIPLGK